MSQAEFQQVRSIISRLLNQLNVGAFAHRVGLAQYGQDVKVEFLLNAYQTKEETQFNFKRFRQRRLQPNEPRNLGSALAYARTNFFSSDAGGRADKSFRQFLVVMSGKDSDDDVYKQSRRIKSEGVTVVAMSFGASMQEMRVVATAPHVYQSTGNSVPVLKSVFETEDVQTILTGGNYIYTI